MTRRALLFQLLARMRQLRTEAGLSEDDMDKRLVLGPGWTERFESGDVRPSVEMLAAMLSVLNKNFSALIKDWEPEEPTSVVERQIWAEEAEGHLLVHFRYAAHDAQYIIPKATLAQFTEVLSALRDGLAGSGEDVALLSDAVCTAFDKALSLWPDANPSDLWYFVILRTYCDPYNHAARFARKSFEQSWKRTGGWALEKVFVDHYQAELKRRGVNIRTGTKEEKVAMLRSLGLPHRLEADKLDVLLTADTPEGERFFGMAHVKASFAERRTDDVPMSEILINAGFTSVLLTMDCKASPSERPQNRGELGRTLTDGRDLRSAKRKDIEDAKSFSACFSYNKNTLPTPATQNAAARVYVADFANPADQFVDFIAEEWDRIRSGSRIVEKARQALESAASVR